MADEAGLGINDLVVAQLVECAPDAADVVVSIPVSQPNVSPVQRAREATIEQVGADPPPRGDG